MISREQIQTISAGDYALSRNISLDHYDTRGVHVVFLSHPTLPLKQGDYTTPEQAQSGALELLAKNAPEGAVAIVDLISTISVSDGSIGGCTNYICSASGTALILKGK